MRLVGQRAKANARPYWMALHQCQRAADGRRRKEAVLSSTGVPQCAGKAECDPDAALASKNSVNARDIQRCCDREPGYRRRNDGQHGESRGHQQERRRIEPRIETVRCNAGGDGFEAAFGGPVIGARRRAIEHGTARGPDADEVRCHRIAVLVDQPLALQERAKQEHRIGKRQR